MLLSLSLSESGVDADKDDRDGRDIEIDFDDRSRTFTIGPCVGMGEPVCVEPEPAEPDMRGLNAAIDCETPAARINCSRNSMLVRPLALHGSFLTKNSSSATHPPPTRTITVLLRIRTRRSF